MRRLVRPLVFTALAACCAAAFAAAPESAPLGKLPRWAVPEAYTLAFKVDPSKDGFSGSTRIALQLLQPSDHLWLHGKALKVARVEVTDAAGKTHAATYVEAAAKEGVARIDFGSTLQPQQLTVTIDYTAPYDKELEGLYKVDYAGHPYAMTQMEPVSARFAFPGFDEPSFKTPYQISLTIPDDQVGVANTRQISSQPAGKGWKTLTFAKTLPLPTYLVAFGVGPWDVQPGPDITPDAYRSGTLALRGIASKGEGHRLQHVLGETPSIIHALEDYYGFGYPYDKLDLLAAPDFSAGAMENPGLVTFRDYLLLLDKDSAAVYVQESFNTVAHELAHQWTGDTVTMRWWNDLWLNESFANWMQQKVTQKVHPQYRPDLDRVLGAEGAMGSDSLVSARKMRQEITGNGDIENAFDGITYDKGAAVLGMFEGYVGADTFQKGMRAYIQAHKFGNADADDLIDAIADAAGKGDDFKQAFHSFLDQAGVPYVKTTLASDHGKTVLKLAQSRYFPLGSSGNPDQTWGVPLCVRYGVPGGSKSACQLLTQPTGEIVLDGASAGSWVMPNANATGYYRFGLDKAALAILGKAVGQLSDAEKLAYGDAVRSGFSRGELDAGDVLRATRPLAASPVREVAQVPMRSIGFIRYVLAQTPAQRAHVDAWARDAYLGRMQQLGYQRKPGESGSDALLRGRLAGFLGFTVKLPEVRAELVKQGDAVLKDKPDGSLDFDAANPDLIESVLGVAVQERGKPAVDRLIAALPRTTDPAHRNAILGALSSTEDPVQAEHVRNLALSEDVKVGEMFYLVHAGKDDSVADRDVQWTWFAAHYPQIRARIGAFQGGSLPAIAAEGACTPAESARLDAFFQPRLKDLPGAIRGLKQAKESIGLCVALKARQDPAAILR